MFKIIINELKIIKKGFIFMFFPDNKEKERRNANKEEIKKEFKNELVNIELGIIQDMKSDDILVINYSFIQKNEVLPSVRNIFILQTKKFIELYKNYHDEVLVFNSKEWLDFKKYNIDKGNKYNEVFNFLDIKLLDNIFQLLVIYYAYQNNSMFNLVRHKKLKKELQNNFDILKYIINTGESIEYNNSLLYKSISEMLEIILKDESIISKDNNKINIKGINYMVDLMNYIYLFNIKLFALEINSIRKNRKLFKYINIFDYIEYKYK